MKAVVVQLVVVVAAVAARVGFINKGNGTERNFVLAKAITNFEVKVSGWSSLYLTTENPSLHVLLKI